MIDIIYRTPISKTFTSPQLYENVCEKMKKRFYRGVKNNRIKKKKRKKEEYKKDNGGAGRRGMVVVVGRKAAGGKEI